MIKLLLISALVGAGVLLLRGRPRALGLLVRRSLAVTTLILGVIAVLRPDWVTVVASWVGVGRGTDLMLYALAVAFVFVTIAVQQRFADLQDRYVTLARAHALLQSQVEARLQGTLEGTGTDRTAG